MFFIIEMDGVAVMEASKVSEAKLKHNHVLIHTGTREKPYKRRGKSEVAPVTVTHARFISGVGSSVFQWFNDFTRGISVERRNMRIVKMDEDGQTPVETTDLIDCVPGEFNQDEMDGEGKSEPTFSFSVEPEDFDFVG